MEGFAYSTGFFSPHEVHCIQLVLMRCSVYVPH